MPAIDPVSWLAALLLTLAVELPLYWQGLRRRVSGRRALGTGAACSLLTHPLLWFVWPAVAGGSYVTYVVTGELLVVALEGCVVLALARPTGLRGAFGVALLANAASFGVGWFVPLRELLG